MEQKSIKRPWRKLVKKFQRKRRRQRVAQKRDRELEEAKLEKLKDPLYKSWLEQQEIIERDKQLAEENLHQEQEELWLRRELLAQKQFKRYELERQAEESKLETERLKQEEKLKLLEEAREKKRLEIKLQAERAEKEFDNIMKSMEEYIENCAMKTPPRLTNNIQSRPGEKTCEFFDKTNCCRFGHGCSFNHKRPILAKLIFIKHFFQHPLMKQEEHSEYSRSDSELELEERDLRDSYDEFCEDVWPVLETFGTIINFRTVRNVQAHLRGHVFVEYADKRSALKAFINLQNRYYASKRLSVEFSNIVEWRAGVCGMRSFLKGLALDRKCQKGDKCNFFHIMKNMDNKYNKPIVRGRSSGSVSSSARTVRQSPIISWNSEDSTKSKSLHSRNWRWSESPEIELNNKNKDENCEVNETKNENLSKSLQRKFRSRSKSKSSSMCYKRAKRSRSNSPNLDHDKSSINSASTSRHSPHCKNKTKSLITDIQEKCNDQKKFNHKSKSSKKSKSHRRSTSPNLSSSEDKRRKLSKSNAKSHHQHKSRKKSLKTTSKQL